MTKEFKLFYSSEKNEFYIRNNLDSEQFFLRELDIQKNQLNLENQKSILSMLAAYFPLFDRHSLSANIPNLFLKQFNFQSITFFGGTFDPFHLGHFECLKLCPEENIMIMPDCSPFKSFESKMNPLFDYLKMAKELESTNYSIYPGFWANGVRNPTSEWIARICVEEKNMILGDDSYMSLLTWSNPSVILKILSKLYVVPRLFKKEDYLNQELEIKKINQNLKIIYLAEHPYMNLSSTGIRDQK